MKKLTLYNGVLSCYRHEGYSYHCIMYYIYELCRAKKHTRDITEEKDGTETMPLETILKNVLQS